MSPLEQGRLLIETGSSQLLFGWDEPVSLLELPLSASCRKQNTPNRVSL